MATDAEIHTLHRYWIWQNKMREHFDELLTVTSPRGERITLVSDAGIHAFLYMSYWYGGLYVVMEGWRDLKLEDEAIDRMLESGNVDLLRRYRNGVFHYQREYFDERLLSLIRDGENVVEWVRELNRQFGRYFLEWSERRKTVAEHS